MICLMVKLMKQKSFHQVGGLEESTDSTKTLDTQNSEINSQTTDNNDNEDLKDEVETNDNLENNLQNNLDDENEESQTINKKDDNQENVEDANVVLNDLNPEVSLLNNDIMSLSLPTLQQFDEIYTLSEDGIPSQYAWGIVNTNVGSGNISVHGLEGPNGSGQYYGSNTSKNTNIYVEYQGAAKIGNETYDIRIYPWSNQSSEYGRYYMQATGGIGGSFNDTTNDNVTLEFHFYKDGEEVSFSGIMYFPDIDNTEGIGFVRGAKLGLRK